MSARKITKTVYLCTCELDDCPGRDPKTGKPKPWVSKSNTIPKRCAWCKRHTWNGVDRRRNEDEPVKKAKR